MSTAAFEVDFLPSISVHPFSTFQVPTTPSKRQERPRELERSASFTSLPGVAPVVRSELKRNFSEQNLQAVSPNAADVSPADHNANIELFKKASIKTKSRMSAAGFVRQSDSPKTKSEKVFDKSDTLSIKSLGRGANALKLFSRSTWGSAPSATSAGSTKPAAPSKHSSGPARLQDLSYNNAHTKSIAIPEPAAGRRARISSGQDALSNTFRRKDSSPAPLASRSLPDSTIDSDYDPASRKPSRQSSFSSLRSRASTDRMYLSVPSHNIPPVPSSISSDRSSGLGHEMKDPYWTQFRTIDGEYFNFAAKTTVQKAKAVRGMLLQFLGKTSDRVTAFSLRAEDLDRRAVILNKWWTAILDLLLSNAQSGVSGSDRPVFLEAMCEIMQRPEWKVPPHQPLAVNIAANTAEAAASSENDDPDYLLRSIHHSIRNMFVHNLVRQMQYVVDKLSQRAAPSSLVVFGGKTCAHAFFYCPGVADMLVRLWHIPAGTLRRIFAEHGPHAGLKASSTSQALATSFPVALRSMCFKSHMTLARHLQNQAQVPPNTAQIRWHGPWINRWTGRDSDLFFVFVKYYHILVAEHLPRRLSLEERLGIPGLVVVHAQLLLNLEATLYRQAGQHAMEYLSASADKPDAIAPLPNFIANATRSIGDNRLVMLLRDSMTQSVAGGCTVPELLVGPFQLILKAAVRKIPMFNSDASFVLCDFLEELMPIISRYQAMHPEVEDWGFWYKVYRQLFRSESTMTQIRAIAFLYATWPILVKDEERQKEVVLDWLLTDETFCRFFNHWSPMVRHYFFRLLCWRVGRCDGTATETDLAVYQRLARLLDRCWAHHSYLSAEADMHKRHPPSGNPCAPAPGRVLLIIKAEGRDASDTFTSFDKLSNIAATQSPYFSQSSMLSKVPPADSQAQPIKKKWGTGILKSFNPFSGPGNARPGEVTPPQSPNSAIADPVNKYKPDTRPVTPPHHALNFRFSLELTNARPQLPIKGRKLPPPQIPHTSQKLLDDLEKLERMSSNEKLVLREIKPVKPKLHEVQRARYSGRALSEWAQVVQECRSFYVRRKQEGCPKDVFVETPHIAVESVRMFG